VYKSKLFTSSTLPENFHFANARNEALAHCQHGWILSIDADEIIHGKGLREFLDSYGYRYEVWHVWLRGEVASVCPHVTNGAARVIGTLRVPRIFWHNGQRQWRYRIHEVPCERGEGVGIPDDICLIEHVTSTSRRTSLLRNLPLLHQQIQEYWRPGSQAEDIVKTLVDLGGTYRDLGRLVEAIGCYHILFTIIVAGDKHLWSYVSYMAALTYYQLGVLTKAIEYAVRAVGYDPELRMGYTLHAAALMRQERYNEALEPLKRAAGLQHAWRMLIPEDGTQVEDEWIERQQQCCANSAV